MTVLQGKIKSVYIDGNGTYLEADVIAGATTLFVNDVDDFDEDGGQLQIEGMVTPVDYLTYTVIPGTGVDAEGTENPPTYTITLSVGLLAGYSESTPVWVYPRGEEKIAIVAVTGNEDEGINVRVPSGMQSVLDDGVRIEGVSDESVLVYRGDDGDMYILEIVGQRGEILAQDYLDTVPQPTSDGLAPSTPTGLTAIPGIKSVVLQWPMLPNYDLVTYNVYGSTTASFTKDATRLLGTAAAGQFTARKAYDNTLAAMVDLIPGVNYYFAITAVDEDGESPASTEVTATPAVITGPDIAAGAVTAAKLVAGAVTAEKLQAEISLLGKILVGSRIEISPAVGVKITLDDGVISFPADGTAAEITAALNATALTVRDKLRVLGINNQIEGSLDLNQSIGDPEKAPTATVGWPTTNRLVQYVWGGGGVPWSPGCEWDATRWLMAYKSLPTDADEYTGVFSLITKSTGSRADVSLGSTGGVFAPVGGVAKGAGTDVFISGYDQNGFPAVGKFNGTTGAFISYFVTNPFSEAGVPGPGGIYSDGVSYVYTAHKHPTTGFAYVYRWPIGGGAGTLMSRTDFACRPGSLYVGNADFGAVRYVMQNLSTGVVEVIGGGAPGTRYTANSFGSPGGNSTRGVWWDATSSRFIGVDQNEDVWKFAPNIAAVNRSLKYTWFDSVSAKESKASPVYVYSQQPRKPFKVICDNLPGSMGLNEPNKVRIYIDADRQTDLAALATQALYEAPDVVGTLVDSPAANNFPTDNPGQIKSEATNSFPSAGTPLFYAKGNGDVRAHGLIIPHAKFITPQRQTVADISIANNTATLLRWTASAYTDPTNIIGNPNIALNADGRITIAADGLYVVKCKFTFASSTAGTTRNLQILLNAGATVIDSDSRIQNGAVGTTLQCVFDYRFVAGDYFTTNVLQVSGGALASFSQAAGYCSLSIMRVAK